MTIDKEVDQVIWWTLQAINRERLLTSAAQNIEINIVRAASRDADAPHTDDISKSIRKLEKERAFKVVEMYDIDSFDPYESAYPDWLNANQFTLAINKQIFDKVYKKYEGRFRERKPKKARLPSPPSSNFDWQNLSADNLKIAQKIIVITLNFLEFQPTTSDGVILSVRIPLQKYESQQLCFDEVAAVLNRVKGIEAKSGAVVNEELSLRPEANDELKQYIFLAISSLDDLHKSKEVIDEKLAHHNPIPITGITIARRNPQVTGGGNPNDILSSAEKKKLRIVEELKELWGLVPKKNYVENSGYISRFRQPRTAMLTQPRYMGWVRQYGLSDFYELRDILGILQEEGLIENFSFDNEYGA